jgi:hypothetical protein
VPLEADATVSILISAGSSYKDHNFVQEETEEEKEKEDLNLLSNSATK